MNKILIMNAIIWAAVILAASYLFKDNDDYNYLLGILTVGFTLQNGFTYTILKKMKQTHDNK